MLTKNFLTCDYKKKWPNNTLYLFKKGTKEIYHHFPNFKIVISKFNNHSAPTYFAYSNTVELGKEK